MERHVAPLTGPAGSGPATAAALQRAAASASPALAASLQEADGLKAWLGTGDDALSAAPPPPKPSRGSPSPSNGAKTAPREVPASVVAAAAAVGQALRNAPQTPFLAMAARASSPPRTSTGSTAPAGGESVWLAAPSGVSAQSRLIVDLPDAEFTYIERPWSHFVTRWAAIDVELEEAFGEEAQFSVIDLGSCCGFFSLQAAAGYPQAFVIGVEGSVGVGNGTTGVEGTQEQIIETKAIQTHLKWVQKLGMTNCLVAPDVWDYHKVCSLAAIGQPICDVMFLLSVVHHVDNVSAEQYEADGLGRVEAILKPKIHLLKVERNQLDGTLETPTPNCVWGRLLQQSIFLRLNSTAPDSALAAVLYVPVRLSSDTDDTGSSATVSRSKRLRIVNGCASEPLWVAHEAGGSVGPDPQNVKVMPMEHRDFTTSNGLAATRFWAKMHCDSSGDQCQLGGSGGPGQACMRESDDGTADFSYCAPAVDSKFEASFGIEGLPCNAEAGQLHGCDHVLASLDAGFTLPFRLDFIGSCSHQDSIRVRSVDCSRLSVERCPQSDELLGTAIGVDVSLQVRGRDLSALVGCYSPCQRLADTGSLRNSSFAAPASEAAASLCCLSTLGEPIQDGCQRSDKGSSYAAAVGTMCEGLDVLNADPIRCDSSTRYEFTLFCPNPELGSTGPMQLPWEIFTRPQTSRSEQSGSQLADERWVIGAGFLSLVTVIIAVAAVSTKGSLQPRRPRYRQIPRNRSGQGLLEMNGTADGHGMADAVDVEDEDDEMFEMHDVGSRSLSVSCGTSWSFLTSRGAPLAFNGLDHIYAAFGTARAFLDAAAKMSGRQWSFVGPLCVSEWYGRREVWLLEEVGIRRPEAAGLRALSRPGLEALFPRVLPSPASTSTFSGTVPSPPGTGGRAVGAAAPALSAAGYKTSGRPSLTPQEELGAALLAAPTALIAAHLQLRDAMVSAETLLHEAATTASIR
ncbi:unnamed protein product [Polarella glacialis]|uniref:Uncharacterized protein n=1 Tax=Polarella glacialis TaxID=89957 RepID=A0A813H0I0_POLGL|nr:unnamed protein product [Polarella glacialis]